MVKGRKRRSSQGLGSAYAMAKVLSERLGGDLTIAIDDDPRYNPETDTLYVPALPGQEYSDEALTMLRAYLHHEAGVERGLTTWDPADPEWANRPGLRALVNMLCDAWGDGILGERYPGYAMDLSHTIQDDMSRVDEVRTRIEREGHKIDGAKLFPAVVKYIAEGELSFRDARKRFPECAGALDTCRDVIMDPDLLASEASAIDAARTIYRRITGQDPRESDDGPGQSGDDSDDGESGDGFESGDSGDESGESGDENAPGGVGDGSLSNIDNVDHYDPHEATLRRALSELLASPGDGDEPYTWTFDPTLNETVTVQAPPGSGEARPDYGLVAQTLEHKLRGALAAPEPRWRRGLDKGDVDERRISSLATGTDRRVFRRRQRQEGLSTAVTVSWDESFSMSGQRIQAVRVLACALNQALGRIGIATQLRGWRYNSNHPAYSVTNNLSERRGTDHRIYKDFGDRWNDPRTVARLSAISCRGGTPMMEALRGALDDLSYRPERRRILFFLTDGQAPPRGHYYSDGWCDSHRYIRDLVARASEAGIEIVSVGIRQDVSHLFPHSIRVNDPSELRTRVGDELVNLLRDTGADIAGL